MPLKIYTYNAGDMAALVQRGGKLSYVIEQRSTVRRIVVVASCVSVEKRFFMVTFFVAESFLHTMKVLNAFQAISKGLNLKVFQGSMSPDTLVASR